MRSLEELIRILQHLVGNCYEAFLFQNTHRARSNTFHHLELCSPQENSKPFSSETNLDNKGNSVPGVHYSSNVSLTVLPFPDMYNSQILNVQSDKELTREILPDRINWLVVKKPETWMVCASLMFYAGAIILVYQSMPAFAEESGTCDTKLSDRAEAKSVRIEIYRGGVEAE